MKTSLFYLSLLSITIISFSFIKKPNRSGKFLPKELKDLKAVVHIPSGSFNGEAIDAYFMFSKEVSNIDYQEFTYYLKTRNRTKELRLANIDTALWKNIDANGNNFYSKRYHKMHEYPVVNISKQAAELYCDWLSEIWNNQQDKFIVEFRLPTKDEWEYAALGGKETTARDYPWSGEYCRNSKGEYLAQHKAFGLSYGPSKVNSFFPNEFGLYNMSGNVSEMISDQEITKGGAWNDNEDAIKIKSSNKLEKSPFVGFRPVMTLKLK